MDITKNQKYLLIAVIAAIMIIIGVFSLFQETTAPEKAPVSEKTQPTSASLPPPLIDISAVENSENSLSAESENFSEDLSDLEDFEADDSLDELGNDLSGI